MTSTDGKRGGAVPSEVSAKAARHGALGLIGAVSAGLGGLALTIIVSQLISPGEAGIYFTTVALFTIATGILLLGSDTGLVRALSGLRVRGDTAQLRPLAISVLRTTLLGALIVAVIAFVWAEPLAQAVFSDATAQRMSSALRIVAPFLPLSVLSMVLLNGVGRGLGSLRSFTLLQQIFLPAGRALFALVSLGLLAVWGSDRLGPNAPSAGEVALFAWTIPLLIVAVLAWRAIRRLLPAAAAHEPPDLRAFWRSTAPRGIAATFEVIIVWADVVLVTALLGPRWGGIYAAASRFVTSGTFALQAVRLSVGPLLAAAFARGDREEAEGVHRLSVQWALLSTWPVYVAMAIFASGVLHLLGPEFTSAATALSILCLAMLGVVATGNANTVLNMAHRSHWAAMNTGAAVIVMLVLDLLLIPRIGIVGAAIGWSAAMLLDACCGVIEVRHGLGLRSFDRVALRAALTVLLGFGLPALGVRLLADRLVPQLPDLAVLIAGTGIAAVVYLAALARQRRALALDHLVAAVRRRPAPGAAVPIQSRTEAADPNRWDSASSSTSTSSSGRPS